MNRLEELQASISNTSKSVIGYTVDWIEWSARKNLAIAEDVAEFTVAQLRLPVEVEGLTEYRHGLQNAYGDFGDVLKHHGEDYLGKFKALPADVRDIFAPKKAAAPKAKAARPKAAAARKGKATAAASGKAA